jgi:hypothetical protein
MNLLRRTQTDGTGIKEYFLPIAKQVASLALFSDFS